MLLTLEFCVTCVEVNVYNEYQNIFCKKKNVISVKQKSQQVYMIVDRTITFSDMIFLNISF